MMDLAKSKINRSKKGIKNKRVEEHEYIKAVE